MLLLLLLLLLLLGLVLYRVPGRALDHAWDEGDGLCQHKSAADEGEDKNSALSLVLDKCKDSCAAPSLPADLHSYSDVAEGRCCEALLDVVHKVTGWDRCGRVELHGHLEHSSRGNWSGNWSRSGSRICLSFLILRFRHLHLFGLLLALWGRWRKRLYG